MCVTLTGALLFCVITHLSLSKAFLLIAITLRRAVRWTMGNINYSTPITYDEHSVFNLSEATSMIPPRWPSTQVALILLYQFSVAHRSGDNTLQDEIASLLRGWSAIVPCLTYTTWRYHHYIKVIPVSLTNARGAHYATDADHRASYVNMDNCVYANSHFAAAIEHHVCGQGRDSSCGYCDEISSDIDARLK